jgi:hypothetical protein
MSAYKQPDNVDSGTQKQSNLCRPNKAALHKNDTPQFVQQIFRTLHQKSPLTICWHLLHHFSAHILTFAENKLVLNGYNFLSSLV